MSRYTRTFGELLQFMSRGDVATKLSAEMENCLAALEEAPDGKKAKAELTLKITFEHELGRIDVRADIKTKLPDINRFAATPYWLHDGKLSSEHPNQINMFAAPAIIRDDDSATG